MHSFIKKRKGLTLMEVLIVLVFLGIVFVPILQMFSRTYLISTESEMSLKATALAEKYLEEEKNTHYSVLTTESKTSIEGFPGFSREIIVTDPEVNLKEVEVRIYYPVGNTESMISVKTLVANF